LAIVLTTITTLISIVTLPLTMWVGVGVLIKFDPLSMILNLIQMVLLPLLAAIIFSKYLTKVSRKVSKYGYIINSLVIIFILWGGVASGINYIESNVYDFIEINLVVTSLLTVALLSSYGIGKMFSKKHAITLSIATFLKNATLALVIGLLTFGSGVLPALVSHIIDQNILLIFLGLFIKR